MCNCINIETQSAACYAQMITVDIPDHMSEYRDARLRAGLSGQVSIDPCIYDEIKGLWDKGVITYGSCCGHNKYEPFVNVDQRNIQQLLDMGYVQNHPDKNRKDTFKLHDQPVNNL